MVVAIVRSGADVYAKDPNGLRSIDLAEKQGDEIAEKLSAALSANTRLIQGARLGDMRLVEVEEKFPQEKIRVII